MSGLKKKGRVPHNRGENEPAPPVVRMCESVSVRLNVHSAVYNRLSYHRQLFIKSILLSKTCVLSSSLSLLAGTETWFLKRLQERSLVQSAL